MTMKLVRRFIIVAATLIFFDMSTAHAQRTGGEAARIDRLVGVARLWAAVKYFHPYLAYRSDIDWDAALIKAIPQVTAARTPAEYSAAVESMLEALGDPVSHVLKDSSLAAPVNLRSSTERQPTFQRNANGVLVVEMTNYADFVDYVGTLEKLNALKKEIPAATAIVFDLRPGMTPSESEQGMASFSFSESGLSGALTTSMLELPSERRRMYLGYAPQQGATSGNYSSGFYLEGRPPIKPEAGAKDIPVVFLVGPHADLPDVALGLQASAKGAIVAEENVSDETTVSTQIVELPEGVRAQFRLGELVYEDGGGGFEPNLTVPASGQQGTQNSAFQAALRLAESGKFSAPSHMRLPDRAAGPLDNTYADMPYPPAEYRVLAAFRIWAVIDIFYPYKDLIGEDWDGVLRQFIPRMEDAQDALDYNLTVAEMLTHIHDSHARARSPFLDQFFGEASAPIRVRMIENTPVITGFTDAQAAKHAGLEIGDVILKVDGEDADQRIARRLKFTAFSMPQTGTFYATERGLVRGPKDSLAKFTVRDLRDQIKQVEVARKVEFVAKSQGDRTGDVLRILPGNIGYADLDRLTVPQVDGMFEKFKECPAIIFDDRGYPQETAWPIAPRLTDKTDVVAAMFRRRDPMSPDLPNGEVYSSEAVTTFFQRLPPSDKWRYHGKTVLLIDERTQSQAEHTGLFFEAANGTKFIGSPTSGANGDVTYLSVPGGIYVSFTGQGVWHADGRQLQRVGLKPDIEVRPTLAGIRAGRDEVLEKAIEYLRPGGQGQ
jgi:C-terminal processing protease CtpA/Prc